jgi:hypothetical protein
MSTPNADSKIAHWWSALSAAVPMKKRKEINSLVLLVARCIWLERNIRVFDKIAAMPMEVCRKIRTEFFF